MKSNKLSSLKNFNWVNFEKVVVLHRKDPVRDAAHAMCENNVGCVVIGDKRGFMVGILTDRDIVCSGLAREEMMTTPIEKIMTKGLIWTTPSATVSDVINLMIENGIRRVPIIVKTNRGLEKCVGIVTLDDLVVFRLITVDQMAEVILSQIVRTPRTRKGRAARQKPTLQMVVERGRKLRRRPSDEDLTDIEAEELSL